MSNEIEIAKTLFLESLKLQNQGELLEATIKLEQALTITPQRPSIINNLILLYFSLKLEKDLDRLLLIIDHNENSQLLQIGSIYSLFLKKNYQPCIDECKKLLISDKFSKDQLLDLLVKSHFQQMNLKELFINLRLSLKSKKFLDQKLYNAGQILMLLSKPRAAIYFINKALQLNYNYSYLSTLAHCYLKLKDLKKGFDYWEYRKGSFQTDQILFKDTPPLTQLSLIKDKNIVVYFEQGIGDTLNFSRYVKELKKYDCHITFIVQDNLIKVFELFDEDITIKTYDNSKNKKFDYQISLLSLPRVLKSNYEDIKYYNLSINTKTPSYQLNTNYFNVGFAISGNPNYLSDPYRSIKNEAFNILFGNKKINFYKLNNNNDKLPKDLKNLFDLGDMSFFELSQILKKFNLVISTDTSIIHLCGLLGVNSILLLNYNSDWRWFDDNKKTIWYPSIRIVKQKALLNWDQPLRLLNRYLRKTSNKST